MYSLNTLLDELFQVFSEGPVVNGLVSLTVMIGAMFFCSRKRDRTEFISDA